MSRPANAIRPSLARYWPLRRLKRVVFPAPFGPMIDLRVPLATSSDTWSTATCPPKRMVRFCVWRSGGSVVAIARAALPRPEKGAHRRSHPRVSAHEHGVVVGARDLDELPLRDRGGHRLPLFACHQAVRRVQEAVGGAKDQGRASDSVMEGP